MAYINRKHVVHIYNAVDKKIKDIRWQKTYVGGYYKYFKQYL